MKMLRRKAKTALNILSVGGVRGLRRHWNKLSRQRREDKAYQKWLKFYGTIGDAERIRLSESANTFEYEPLISIILPVYNIDEKWLRKCIGSVIAQIYTNWELCIADDASTEPHVARVLNEFADAEPRIKIVFRETNGHISAASNSALELATGEFCVLLDHDDELSEDALFYVVEALNEDRGLSMIYSDEDKTDGNGRRFYPSFKPDWSRDLFYSINLVTHLSAYRTKVLRDIGGFRTGYEGSQDYDLALRVIEQIPDEQIRHIPRILYHWRAIAGSVALSGGEKSYAHERARLALRSHFERNGKNVTVSETVYGLHRVRYELPERPPKTAVMIDTFLAKEALTENFTQIISRTDYPNFEVIAIADKNTQSTDGLTFVQADSDDRAERLNTAAFQSDADIYIFLENGIVPADPDWLDELVRFALQEDIGAVGGKILTTDGIVISNGLILGAGEGVADAHEGLYAEESGNMWRNIVTGNFSAVSARAMAVRGEVFRMAGGFDTEMFPQSLFDADLCLRLREKGLRIVSTPYAQFTATEDPARDITEDERRNFTKRWEKYIERDPFYNENLSKRNGTFSIDI